MSPYRLALRTLMLGRTRSVLAMLLIAASLCVLDLFAGNIASTRARMEFQAVITDRLGHLTILPMATQDNNGAARLFNPSEAGRIQSAAEAHPGVAMVLPQMSVHGIAATEARSAVFYGEGVTLAPAAAGNHPWQQLPGKLTGSVTNGVAVSTRQAQTLGVRSGSKLTLTGASVNAAPRSVQVEVVDIYQGAQPQDGHSVIMPLELAQTLRNTTLTERFVVFISDAARLEEQRGALVTALRADNLPVEVHTWQEESANYGRERSATDLVFDSVAGMVFAVIAATISATISINALERRREVGTLRALGMRSHSVFLMFVTEALGMVLAGVVASLIASGLIAWVVNRAALSYATHPGAAPGPMLVELDFNRMGMAVVAVLAVALMAALVPAFKAARAPIAPALA